MFAKSLLKLRDQPDLDHKSIAAIHTRSPSNLPSAGRVDVEILSFDTDREKLFEIAEEEE
jgi:hypothetical protein